MRQYVESNMQDYQSAMNHLRQARRYMTRLTDCFQSDWTAIVSLEEEFRNIRKECRNFAKHQCALPIDDVR